MKRTLALLILTLTSAAAGAADMQKLVQETQRLAQGPDQMTMVWWMPTQFWDAALSNSPALTKDGKAQVLAVFDDYIVFALVRAKVSISGLDARPKPDLLANSKLEVDGRTIEAIAPAAINPGAQALLASLKPTLAGMLGSFGQAIELVVYPAKQGDRRLLDPLKPGGFSYTLYDQSFKWRLPLGSLLPPKVDPATKEEFPGNYDFNPFTGGKLRAR